MTTDERAQLRREYEQHDTEWLAYQVKNERRLMQQRIDRRDVEIERLTWDYDRLTQAHSERAIAMQQELDFRTRMARAEAEEKEQQR